MPLQKILFKPGVNRENTRYTTEGGWYDGDKIRFRQGTPEKIGGWNRVSTDTYLGVCRSLWAWSTVDGVKLMGVGTNLKFYIQRGGAYYDITPIRGTATLTNPFAATNGSNIITVTDTAHGAIDGDFVTFSGATGLGGDITAAVLNQEYQIDFVDLNTYRITATATANATDVSGSPGGGTVTAAYQINTGPAEATPISGWGASAWGNGTWGNGETSSDPLRLWTQANFGENLVFGPRGGGLYYWTAASGVTTRGVALSTIGDAEAPTVQNAIAVSDASRFVFAFGCDDYGSINQDRMLIRWSDQEDPTVWDPAITNQAGSIRLSHGSEIITYLQTRQEILVWTDTSLYSMQYLGSPYVWGSQLLGDNVSIISQNAVAVASGITYWMGVDKFYKYDGRVQTLRCDLRQYIFSNINIFDYDQVFAGTNEGFNEVWWFYCSSNATAVDKYVVYNYAEDIWYYGSMSRSAWLDSGLNDFPIAATYINNLVTHEDGLNDNATGTPVAIDSFITSSEFDIGDGHNFGFVWRILPDITFRGSTTANPAATMYLYPLQNSGSGYNNPTSEGGINYGDVVRTSSVPIEKFTGQVYVRVRGRQMAFKITNNQLDSAWQLGSPRIDIKPDGRR
jgi:hypothetical protein